MSNTSDVPLSYNFLVCDDGNTEPVCFDSYKNSSEEEQETSDQATPSFPKKGEGGAGPPREFRVEPSCGVVEPWSCVTTCVQLCPNTQDNYYKVLSVEMAEIKDHDISLPITATYAL